MWFEFDSRLGIELPNFPTPFEELPVDTQAHVVALWDKIRAKIPDRIADIEHDIARLLDEIQSEDDWDEVVRRFASISDLASRTSDLNHWNRIDPGIIPSGR